jgi:hypothetical protein
MGISFRYVGWIATPRLIPGTFADFEKKSTFGALARLNLNPRGLRKFLFAICLSKAPDMVFTFIYLQ